ncbi:hypothetical protein ACMV8I_09065 [Ewingella sp. S1.OA.A_B6]
MKRLIPYENDGKELSVSYLQHHIDARLSDIEELLVGNLSYYSENAQYTLGSLKVMSITAINNDVYSMSYQFKWSMFNDCLDINAEEITSEKVTFKVKTYALVFDIIDTQRSAMADEL